MQHCCSWHRFILPDLRYKPGKILVLLALITRLTMKWTIQRELTAKLFSS